MRSPRPSRPGQWSFLAGMALTAFMIPAAARATAIGVVGAAIGMAAVAVLDGGGSSDVTVGEGALVGALYVAPVGIVIGGLSGAAVRRWVTVHQRPGSSPSTRVDP